MYSQLAEWLNHGVVPALLEAEAGLPSQQSKSRIEGVSFVPFGVFVPFWFASARQC